MLEAHSLKSISKKVASDLPRIVTYTKKEPSLNIGVITTLDMSRPTRYQNVQIEEKRNSKLVGILFSHPKTSLAKSEIIDQLGYYHVRSGEAVDFFCVGYGAYWPPEHFTDQTPVTKIDGVNWLFSEQAFFDVIDELETETKWKFSGETELLLVSAIKEKSGRTILDYSNALVCNLEVMAKDQAFTSVRAFFTYLFRYAKTHSISDPAWGLSDNQGACIAKSALKDAILSLLPKNLKANYKKAEHYAIRDIAK